MKENDIRAIVITEDHYNALGMVRSLGLANIDVFLILTTTSESYVDSSRYVLETKKVNHTKEDIIAAVQDIVSDTEHKYVIFPLSDFSAFIVDEEVKKFGHNVLAPHAQGLMKRYSDKFEIKELVKKCGMTVPKGMKIDLNNAEPNDWNTYPAIIKPLVSVEGSKSDISIAESENDLQIIIQKYNKKGYSNAILEEYISGSDAHMIEVMGARNIDGSIDYAGIISKIREYPIKNGSTSYARVISKHEDIDFDKISAFLSKIGFVGLFDIEFKFSNGKAYFIECNFRNGAPGFIFTLSGANIPAKWIYKNVGPFTYSEFKMKNDVLFMVEQCDLMNMIKGSPKLLVWIRQFIQSTKIFWFTKDIIPVIKYYYLFLREIKQHFLRRRNNV